MSKNGTLFFERSLIPKIFWLKFDVTSALVKNIHQGNIGHHMCFKYDHLSLLIWSKIEMFGSWQRPETYSIAMATTHWVSFCFLPDVQCWCQV